MSLRALITLNAKWPQVKTVLYNPSAVRSVIVASSNFSTSAVNNVKQIVKTEVNGKLVIEGVMMPSEREALLAKPLLETHEKVCSLCRLNLDLKHTDVLILSQFVRENGCMLPRRITGLCKTQQKRVYTLVAMAQKAGLMTNLTPTWSHKDPTKRYKWKKFNTYFDETTIKY